MSIVVGALWKNRTENDKAPILRGNLEIRDDVIRMKIAETLAKGERVRIAIFKGKGSQDGKRYPDYSIVLDTYEKEQPQKNVNDDIPF